MEYGMKRLIGCMMAVCSMSFVHAQHFPLQEQYVAELEKRNGLEYFEEGVKQRMADHTELGLPAKDLLKLKFSGKGRDVKLDCTFRFRANYETIKRQLSKSGCHPLSTRYMNTSFIFWMYPELGIKAGLGIQGKVAANGNADYRYIIRRMTADETGGCFMDENGQWKTFRMGTNPVGIIDIPSNAKAAKKLLDRVIPANRLQAYLLAPVNGLSWCLDRRIPRKELPRIGQVYATADLNDSFPVGFAGKVKAVKKSEQGFEISFHPVAYNELFNVE